MQARRPIEIELVRADRIRTNTAINRETTFFDMYIRSTTSYFLPFECIQPIIVPMYC